VAPLASNVLSRISAQQAGAASGVLATGLQVGNAIGVAIVGVIFYGMIDSLASPSYAEAFMSSLACLIVMNLALSAMVQLLPARVMNASMARTVGSRNQRRV